MKTQLYFFLLFLLIVMGAHGQEKFFSGYVLDCDSMPIENAVLINYRSLRAFTTKEDGSFKVPFQTGDSIKINHISYAQKVIHPNEDPRSSNTFYLEFDPFEIRTVAVTHNPIELQYFERNMARIFEELKLQRGPQKPTGGPIYNPYDPSTPPAYAGINFIDLYKLLKKKKVF
jgi:hypothetical protein